MCRFSPSQNKAWCFTHHEDKVMFACTVGFLDVCLMCFIARNTNALSKHRDKMAKSLRFYDIKQTGKALQELVTKVQQERRSSQKGHSQIRKQWGNSQTSQKYNLFCKTVNKSYSRISQRRAPSFHSFWSFKWNNFYDTKYDSCTFFCDIFTKKLVNFMLYVMYI